MNFLGHLLIADRTGTSLAGAVLGDFVRGRDFEAYPADVALGIRLHRRVDTLTDRHPQILAAIAAYPAAGRRYAPVLLDIVADHCLIRRWRAVCDEPFETFCARCGAALTAATPWFRQAGARAPTAGAFEALLLSYAQPDGVERAIRHTAQRLRSPEPMQLAGRTWRSAADALEPRIEEVFFGLVQGAARALPALGRCS